MTGPSSERTADASDLMKQALDVPFTFDLLRDPEWQPTRENYAALRDAIAEVVARHQQLQEALAGTCDRDRFGDIDIGPCWCPDWKTEEWHGDDPDEYVHHPACAAARAALASVPDGDPPGCSQCRDTQEALERALRRSCAYILRNYECEGGFSPLTEPMEACGKCVPCLAVGVIERDRDAVAALASVRARTPARDGEAG